MVIKTHEFSEKLARKATLALLKHTATPSSGALIEDVTPVYMQFTLQRVPQNPSLKPYRLAIPNPLHALQEGDDLPSVCIFVKQESKKWVKEFVAGDKKLSKLVKKVMGLDSLRKSHSRYSDRRELLRTYDFFLADDRILPMLSKSLGKNFFEAKKQPVAIKITRKESLKHTIERSLKSTYMFMPSGTCMQVRGGDIAMGADKLVANFKSIVDGVTERIPKGWSNVSAINIKTADSAALPIYLKNAEELMETARLAGVRDENDESDNQMGKGRREREARLLETKGGKKRTRERSVEGGEEEVGKKKTAAEKKLEAKKKDKSPLVRALKKQEEEEKEEVEPVKKKKKTAAVLVEEIPEKKKKKKDADQPAASVEEKKKSKKKDTAAPDVNKPVQALVKDFIKSKKFVGPKAGMCFKLGDKGMGYYKDTPPKFDAVGVAALRNARVRNTPSRGGGGGGRKRKGRR